jgi:hypothetical protein
VAATVLISLRTSALSVEAVVAASFPASLASRRARLSKPARSVQIESAAPVSSPLPGPVPAGKSCGGALASRWITAPAWADAQAAAEALRPPSAGQDEGQEVPAPSVAEERRPVARRQSECGIRIPSRSPPGGCAPLTRAVFSLLACKRAAF